MASVELEGVSRRFSPTTLAVDDVDLKVNDREFLVLVGPSGCGKSTTLRLIAGLETCDKGIIRIGDRQVNQVAPKDRDIAMVFQNYALYPHMSVYKNLSFGLQLRLGGGLISRVILRVANPRRAAEISDQRREIKKRVTQTAERLGIEKLLKRKPHQLSGGERQRVALGRAIVREPAAFLFDEPLSNLDAKLRNQLRTEIKRLHHELNTTMIYVTHDQIEAMTLGDRIAVMNKGRIQQIGNPLQIYRQPNNLFVAGFIGSLPMNLFDGILRFDSNHGSFHCQHIKIELGEKAQRIKTIAGNAEQVVLGVRPENILIDSNNSAPPISAKTVSVDRLGDSTVVHLESMNHMKNEPINIVVRANAGSSINRGDVVSLQLDLDAAHWFDAQTGENLQQKQNQR